MYDLKYASIGVNDKFYIFMPVQKHAEILSLKILIFIQ